MKKISLIFCVLIHTISAFNPYNYPCVYDNDCEQFIADTTCVNSICVCPPGEIISGDLIECVKISVGYGANCTENIQCSEYLLNGGHCYNDQQCQCEDNFHYRDGRCYKTKQFGDACSANSDCYNGFDIEALSCIESTCQCTTDPKYYSRTPSDCRRAATKDGDACLIDLDCRQYNSKATCTDFKCKSSKILGEDIDIVINKNNKEDENILYSYNIYDEIIDDIGESCVEDTDCNTTNSWCYEFTCQCKRGYLHNITCTPELGSNAASTKDCQNMKYAEYRDGKCLCPVGYAYASNNLECYKGTQKIENSCTRDENCYTFGSTSKCINWKCECVGKDWYDDSLVMCHHPAEIGETCTNDTDCKINPDLQLTSPICDLTTKKCDCPENFYNVHIKNYCQNKDSKLGDSCYQSTDCHTIANSECTNGICSCSDTYYPNDGICKNGPGHACDTDSDCTALNTFCSNKKCQCKDEYLLVDEICYKASSGINANCEVDQQCQAVLNNGSSCIDNHCFCADEYHVYNNKCWKNKQLGDYCTFNEECQYEIDNKKDTIECRNGKCNCILDAFQLGDVCLQKSDASPKIFTTAMLVLVVLVFLI